MPAVVVATAFGGPEVLSVIDAPSPVPGPGEVVLEVRAAGTNPIDYKQYSGAMGADPADLPKRIGLEASGVVSVVGPGVSHVAVGTEVIGYPVPGAYGTEVVASMDVLVAKPAALSFAAAAGLLLTGGTAVHALTAVDIKDGETVLLHGAAGGVGLFAVQLAVARGATVIATASPAKHELLRRFGAVPIAYGAGLVDRVRAAAPAGIDAAVDLVGTDEAIDASLAVVADRGRIASIAAFGRAKQDGIQLLGNGPGADPGTEIRNAARQQLADAVARGELEVVVASTYPLAQVADAHRELMAGHTTGKIVLTV